MTKNYTAAPWMYTDYGLVGTDADSPVHNVIAEVHDGNAFSAQDSDPEKRTANARLIAAAPELLEALKACYAELNQLAFLSGDKLAKITLDQARAAIDKAESR